MMMMSVCVCDDDEECGFLMIVCVCDDDEECGFFDDCVCV